MWALCALIVVVIIAFMNSGNSPPPRSAAIASSAPLADEGAIKYATVESWDVPPNGWGRVIIVGRINRNERDLRALGLQLDKVSAGARFAIYEVYDDSSAARQREAGIASRLPHQQQLSFNSHFLGTYTRNRSTGYGGLSIFPNGTDGKSVEARY